MAGQDPTGLLRTRRRLSLSAPSHNMYLRQRRSALIVMRKGVGHSSMQRQGEAASSGRTNTILALLCGIPLHDLSQFVAPLVVAMRS